MLALRGFKYRLLPNPEQEEVLLKWRSDLIYLWNVALRQRYDAVLRMDRHRCQKPIEHNIKESRWGQQEQTTDIQDESENLAEIPVCVKQAVIRHLDRAWSSWWDNCPDESRVYSCKLIAPREFDIPKIPNSDPTIRHPAPKKPKKLKPGEVPEIYDSFDLSTPAGRLAYEERECLIRRYGFIRGLRGAQQYQEYLIHRRLRLKGVEGYNEKSFEKNLENNQMKGCPRYKSRGSRVGIEFSNPTVKKVDARLSVVNVPKLGAVTFRKHRPFRGKIKKCNITLRHEGWWDVSLLAECEIADPAPTGVGAVGIDLGITHAIADSDGVFHDLPESVYDLERKVDHLKSTLLASKQGPLPRGTMATKVAICPAHGGGSISTDDQHGGPSVRNGVDPEPPLEGQPASGSSVRNGADPSDERQREDEEGPSVRNGADSNRLNVHLAADGPSVRNGADRTCTRTESGGSGPSVRNGADAQRGSPQGVRPGSSVHNGVDGAAPRPPASKNYLDAKLRIAKLKQKAARIRTEFLHRVANYYVERYSTIHMEDLNIKAMSKSAKGTVEKPGKNVSAKGGLNRRILESGWGEFTTIMKYKCADHGVTLIFVTPKDTSITCHSCGHVDSANRSKRDRSRFRCVQCGHEADADTNAAENIRDKEGTAERKKRGLRRKTRHQTVKRKKQPPATGGSMACLEQVISGP